MSDQESFEDSDREEESETSSDTDAEVKYQTFPNRGKRWPVGSPKPKNPVRGTPWNKYKGLRIPQEDQKNLNRFVPGRLPRLTCKAEAEIAADFKEGGAGSVKAVCQLCKEKFPFSPDPDVESKKLLDHIVECWGPTKEAPFNLYDERVRKPSVLGHLVVEDDKDCLLFSVQSPGTYGGAYMLLLAFPLYIQPTLNMLDILLRKQWFHEEKCSHPSMFTKRSTGTAEEEKKMYKGFKENMAMTVRKKFADKKFLEQVKIGYHHEGKIVWAREYKGVFWPAVVVAEVGTGNLARRDPDEDVEETWQRNFGLQWHVVFLGREGKRMWVRDGYDTFKMGFDGKEEIKKWLERDVPRPEGEEKMQWEEAVKLATKLSELDSEEKVLSEISRLGLTEGEEIVDCSMEDMLVDMVGEEEKNRMMKSWREDYSQFKWSFFKELYGKEKRPLSDQLPCTMQVEKVEGFSYWPIMCGKEIKEDEEEEEASKTWDHLLTPDRTDQSLEEIFTEPGQSAIYQYHLVDGFRSRCKVVFRGQKLLRMRGNPSRHLPCRTQLDRDPEYERDVERINRTVTGGYQKPKEEDIIRPIMCIPQSKPFILAQNEPPFIPCTNCKVKTAQFCDTGRGRDFRSFENPDTRLQGHTGVFCSTACGREWSSSSKTVLPVGDTMDLENSPRAGMCQFSDNIQIRLHLLPLHKLEYELWSLWPGCGLYSEVNYIDDERAEGRHHPLWSKERRRVYRDNKREWQDLILGRIEKFGLEVPPKIDMSKCFYDCEEERDQSNVWLQCKLSVIYVFITYV